MIEDAMASQVHLKGDAMTMPRQERGSAFRARFSPRNLQCRTVLFMRNAREQGIDSAPRIVRLVACIVLVMFPGSRFLKVGR
jgi:hypothetical protein